MKICCLVGKELTAMVVDVGQEETYPELGMEQAPATEMEKTKIGSVWPSGPSKLKPGEKGRYSVSHPQSTSEWMAYGWFVTDGQGNQVPNVTISDPNDAEEPRIVSTEYGANSPVVDIVFPAEVGQVAVLCIINGLSGNCVDKPKTGIVITNVAEEAEPAPQPTPEPPPAPAPEPEPTPEPTPEPEPAPAPEPEPEPVPEPPEWDGHRVDEISVTYEPGGGMKRVSVTYLPLD